MANVSWRSVRSLKAHSRKVFQDPEEEPQDVTIPVQNAAKISDIARMGGTMQEYQCGSDNAEQLGDCESCTMSSTCSTCDGVVKFGYDKKWTPWRPVSELTATGTFECNTATFGADPIEGGRICICRPKQYICAAGQNPSKSCVGELCTLSRTCSCAGEVKYGYGDRWSAGTIIKKSILCGSKKMMKQPDPNPAQDKVCQCSPTDLVNQPLVSDVTDNLAIGGVLSAIIAVIMCYFIVYTWLAVVRTSGLLGGSQLGPSSLERVLEAAATSCVYFAPMLCAIFLAVTKRACTLTFGTPQAYDLPPVWLQWAVAICATAFCAQAATYVLAEWCGVQGVASANDSRLTSGPSVIMQTPAQARTVRFWRSCCNVCTAVMYIALICILCGICLMTEPESVLETVGRIPLHPGTLCTIVLAVAYVIVYVALHIYRNRESTQAAKGPLFGLELLKLAAIAVNFAPMLAVLFLGTQIAVDWDYSELPSTVATWMYICTASVLLQVFLVILAPFVANADLQVVGPNGELDFVTRRHDIFVFISVIRWIAMAAMYVGIVVVCDALWWANTEPAMTHGIYRFAIIYFVTYLALWICITAKQVLESGFFRTVRVLSIAKDTVVFCPMLGALFLASFVRAHAITNKYGEQGVPQSYVLDAMFIAALALLVQLISVCCAGVFVPSKKEGVQDGEMSTVSPLFLTTFHVAMAVLYMCVVVVIVGLFTINKGNATGRGRLFS